MRWSGRFENEASPGNIDLVRNNTFVTFTQAESGDISCRPGDDAEQPDSWTRSINRDAIKSGFLKFELADCANPLGDSIDVPGLPLKIQGTYILEK